MLKLREAYCIPIVLAALACGRAFAQDPTLELIGGSATGLLVSNNLNLGLAVELHKADPKKRAVVIQVAEQTGKTLKVSIDQFERWQKNVKLTKDDGEFLDLLANGLKSARAQAALLKIAVSEDNKSQYAEFEKSRKETFAIIKKVTE